MVSLQSSGKRVCMVVHAYYPLAEPRVQREAHAARDAGFAVEVLCLRGDGDARTETIDGIAVTRLPIDHRRGARITALFAEYVRFAVLAFFEVSRRAVRRELAVVHVHSPPEFLIGAALVARLMGVTVILDVHDLSRHMFSARFRGRFGERPIRFVLAGTERIACAIADHVITVHEPYRREMQALGTPANRVSVIMNSADEALISRVRRSRASSDRDTFVLAYHGTLNQWYGVDLLIEAVALLQDRLPAVSALILGDGDALPALRDLAERLGVADRVQFSGAYLPILDALRTVRSASCGVIPNRPTELNRFALSSKLFEYVALDIPVVVARLATLSAHFDESEVTFFEPGSASSLAAAAEQVARDRAGARLKSERALQRAAEYSWQRNAARYIEILASSHRTGGRDDGEAA